MQSQKADSSDIIERVRSKCIVAAKTSVAKQRLIDVVIFQSSFVQGIKKWVGRWL